MVSEKSSTSIGQRIFIWGIAVLMLFGTIGSFAAMVIATENDQKEQARYNQLMKDYQDSSERQQAELSDKYYDVLKKFADENVSEFDGDDVNALSTKDLKQGDGDTLDENSTFNAYYVGWTPDGNIFDQSIQDGSLANSLAVQPGSVIEGWTEGVKGMKVGGVREITIPSEKAYGESGSGESIPPNTPLKFIILVIPEDPIEPSQELIELYGRLGA